MVIDPSRGWDAVAQEFIALRSDNGADVVRRWATLLHPGGAVVDIGCGSGAPVSVVLAERGLAVFGTDASPALLAEYSRRFPSAETACEAAESSRFFNRSFDGAVAVGLLFLLPADSQRQVIEGVARALTPGGRFLFSAPRQVCEWTDGLTGGASVSLGEEAYQRVLEAAGMRLTDSYVDEGDNHYYDAVRL